jgi:hypothetical protein
MEITRGGHRGGCVDLEFFETLYKDSEFCEALGRMALASGRFESDLRAFLGLKGVKITEGRATLGNLITQLEQLDRAEVGQRYRARAAKNVPKEP